MASPVIWEKILALFSRADSTDKAISNLESSLFDKIYPIGSVYISFSNVNPATLFGGTWEALSAGRVLVQSDSNHPLGNTGGAETITLTEAQLPVHNHGASCNETGGHSHDRGTMNITGDFRSRGFVNAENHCVQVPQGAFYTISTFNSDVMSNGVGGGTFRQYGFDASRSWTGVTSTVPNHAHSITIGSTGSGSAVNIEQPWLAVNMWKRTA